MSNNSELHANTAQNLISDKIHDQEKAENEGVFDFTGLLNFEEKEVKLPKNTSLQKKHDHKMEIRRSNRSKLEILLSQTDIFDFIAKMNNDQYSAKQYLSKLNQLHVNS